MSKKARRLAYKRLRMWQRAINRAQATGTSDALMRELTSPAWLQAKEWQRGASAEDTSRVLEACEATRKCLADGDFLGARSGLIHLQLAL